MPSAPPEAAVPFPQIQYHLLLQQEELQAWKPCLQAGSTMSQAPSQLHSSLLQLLPLSCFLLLLLLELELRLMRALISSLPTPAPPELLLSEASIAWVLCYNRVNSPDFPLTQEMSHQTGVGSSVAVIRKTGMTIL